MTELKEQVGQTLANDAGNVITVWSDIGCPWATLALHTLRQEIRRARVDVLIDHRTFPLEWFNERPTPKPITDAELVAIAGLVGGLEWRSWSAPESTFPVTTLPALEAVQAAKHPRAGGLKASDELDEALRRAFWVDHECISVLPIVYRVAASCDSVDLDGLRWAMATGHGRQAVLEQWPVAQREEVVCSPHFFTARGVSSSNPGAQYTWTGGAEAGFPRLVSYDPQWAAELVDSVAGRS
ncbi:DsbA family oxidoreductase [Nocardioides pyridinolyticus]